MCGIFGILSHRTDCVPDDSRLRQSADLLHHRGPDSSGCYAVPGLGLVSTRLSLVDLSSRGDQPFWDAEHRYAIVYNGEVYNFKELRTELEGLGIRFRSTTDTEVVLEYIKQFGVESALPRLEGMFAFCIYDRETSTLTLARDRFGIKPLFYYDEEDGFIFSSEVAAMRPWITFEPDTWSIASYLFGFGGPSMGYTFYRRIKILPPGGIISIQPGKRAEFSSFFNLLEFYDPGVAERLGECSRDEIVETIEEALVNSIRMQLFADAPVGVLCSGGIDSSVVTAVAARLHNNVAVFHADVEGQYSEHNAARRLADFLKLDLKTTRVTNDDCLDDLPEVMAHFGHPFSIIESSIPFLKVSKLVRSHGVKAVLTGEGSDECFLGYRFLVPVPLWGGLSLEKLMAIVKRIWGYLSQSGGSKRARQFVYGFSPYSSASLGLKRMGPASAESALHLLNRFEVALETEALYNKIREGERQFRDHALSLDLLNYNLRWLLHRNDSMGMAASIESRFPFLDSALVKLAVNLPYSCKIRFSWFGENGRRWQYQNKWALREVAARYLPKDVAHRKKQRFIYDVFERLNIQPSFFANSYLSELWGLSQKEIDYLVNHFPKGLMIKLLHLEVWGETCILNLPRDTIRGKLRDSIQIRP